MARLDCDAQPALLRLPKLNKHDVMLDPYVFRRVTRELAFKPSVDLFASDAHHQVPRYFSQYADPKAAGQDAFQRNWAEETRPYANPPWPLISRVLKKVITDKVRIMLVVPHWVQAPWFTDVTRLTERSTLLTDAVFLDEFGRLRPKPWWHTQICIVNGGSP
jgi:hypothetical protein